MQVPTIFCPTCTHYIGTANICPFCQTPRPAEQRLPAPDLPLWSLGTPTPPGGRAQLAGQHAILADEHGRLVWQYDCGGRIRAPFTAHNHRLYVALRHRDVMALEMPAESDAGQPVGPPRPAWRLPVERPSGLAVEERQLYYGDAEGNVLALRDAGDRPEVAWSAQVGQAVTAAPAHWRHLLLVGTHHHQGHLLALDTQNGQVAWRQSVGGRLIQSPLLCQAGGQQLAVVATDQGRLKAFRLPSGEPEWSYEVSAQPRLPLAAGEGLLFVGTGDGKVLGLDAEMKRAAWQYALSSEPVVSLACCEGLVFAAARDGGVCALEAAEGKHAWRWQAPGAVTGELTAADGRLLVGCQGAGWVALSWPMGHRVWAADWCARRGAPEAAAAFRALTGDAEAAVRDWAQLNRAELAARIWSRFGEDEGAAAAFETASRHWRAADPDRAATHLVDAGDHWSRAGKSAQADESYRRASRMSVRLAHLRSDLFNQPVFDRGLPGTVALRLRNSGNSPARDIRFVLGGRLASTERGELDIVVLPGAMQILEFIDLVPTAVGPQPLTELMFYQDDTRQQPTAEARYEITATELPPGTIVMPDDAGVVSVRVAEGTPLPSVRLQRGVGMLKYEVVQQAQYSSGADKAPQSEEIQGCPCNPA